MQQGWHRRFAGFYDLWLCAFEGGLDTRKKLDSVHINPQFELLYFSFKKFIKSGAETTTSKL